MIGWKNVSSAMSLVEKFIDMKLFACSVYHINWLRVKAQQDRWYEELKLVQNEMKFIVLWFQHQKWEWERRQNGSKADGCEGHRIYACRQVDLWQRFEERAKKQFRGKMVQL